MNALTTSHWIPDGSGPPLLHGATVGGRLCEVAEEVPDRIALVEGLPTPERRRWTYAELLAARNAVPVGCCSTSSRVNTLPCGHTTSRSGSSSNTVLRWLD